MSYTKQWVRETDTVHIRYINVLNQAISAHKLLRARMNKDHYSNSALKLNKPHNALYTMRVMRISRIASYHVHNKVS